MSGKTDGGTWSWAFWKDSDGNNVLVSRSIRYLIQTYCGEYIEREKFNNPQFSYSLVGSTFSITDITLKVQTLNEKCELYNIPLEFYSAKIKTLQMTMPIITCFLSNSSLLEINGLELYARTKNREQQGGSLVFQSMVSDIGKTDMTRSMQLAEGCLRDERELEKVPVQELACYFDSVLSKLKLSITDIKLHIQHHPVQSKIQYGLDICIDKLHYIIDSGDSKSSTQSDSKKESSKTNEESEEAAFVTVKIITEGVTLYTNEMYQENRESRAESVSSDSIYYCAVDSPLELNEMKTTEDILIGQLNGKQDFRFRIKQREDVAGPQIDFDCNLGSLIMFLSPRQLQCLHEVLKGFNLIDIDEKQSSKPMNHSDYRVADNDLQNYVQHEQNKKTQGLHDHGGWSSASLNNSDEERFKDMKTNRICEEGMMNTSFTSTYSEMNTSISRSLAGETSYSIGSEASYVVRKQEKGKLQQSIPLSDTYSELFTANLRIGTIIMVLFHEDILTDAIQLDGRITRATLQQMQDFSKIFFEKVGHISLVGCGEMEFQEKRKQMMEACTLNHIRLSADPVVIKASEKTSRSAKMKTGSLTCGRFEVVENLRSTISFSPVVQWETVELIKFPQYNTTLSAAGVLNHPSVSVVIEQIEKFHTRGMGKKVNLPATSIKIHLDYCEVEVDLSIIDRISNLINPKPLYTSVNLPFTSQKCEVEELSNYVIMEPRLDVVVSAEKLLVHIRFPIPDLRPVSNMVRLPWWKRAVRDDEVMLDFSEVKMETHISPDRCRSFEITSKAIQAVYKEGPKCRPVPFAKAYADELSPSSFVCLVFNITSEVSTNSLDGIVVQLEESDQDSDGSAVHQLLRGEEKGQSPFTKRKLLHQSKFTNANTEELFQPGNKEEMKNFIEHVQKNCRFDLNFTIPFLEIILPSKHILEVLYNRITTDLLLWEPSSPNFQSRDYRYNPSMMATGFTTPLSSDSYSTCVNATFYDSESDSDEGSDMCFNTAQTRSITKGNKIYSKQSKVAIKLFVGEGIVAIHTNTQNSSEFSVPSFHGECVLKVNEATIFTVSSFEGDPTLNYLCVQAKEAEFLHAGHVPDAVIPQRELDLNSSMSNLLTPIISKCNSNIIEVASNKEPGFNNEAEKDKPDMLTVAIKIDRDEVRHVKTFRVAVSIHGATMNYYVYPPELCWLNQFKNFFDVKDYPIAGYFPPSIVTEMYFHWNNCAIDYRPINIAVHSFLFFETLSICTNISTPSNSTAFRFVLDDADLYLSECPKDKLVDLHADYILIARLDSFEVVLRTNSTFNTKEKLLFEFLAHSNMLHIWTCSDSCKALCDFVTYVVNNGDLVEEDSIDSLDLPFTDAASASLTDAKIAAIDDAIEDISPNHGSNINKGSSSRNKQMGPDDFLFPGEGLIADGVKSQIKFIESDILSNTSSEEDCFNIKRSPELKNGITSNGNVTILRDELIEIEDNYFNVLSHSRDALSASSFLPPVVKRYKLDDLSLDLNIYGGYDFESSIAVEQRGRSGSESFRRKKEGSVTGRESSRAFSVPPSRYSPPEVAFRKVKSEKGNLEEVKLTTGNDNSPKINSVRRPRKELLAGKYRKKDTRMKITFTKVRFQHEEYPYNTYHASRQVLAIKDIVVQDKLNTSNINKFLYIFEHQRMPQETQSDALVFKLLHVRADISVPSREETSLKLTVSPIRLNIDQDTLQFLKQFFKQVVSIEDDSNSGTSTPRKRLNSVSSTNSSHSIPIMTTNENLSDNSATSSPHLAEPLIKLDNYDSMDDDTISNATSDAGDFRGSSNAPTYFRSVNISPDIPIKIDYNGKKLDTSNGTTTGLLYALGQFNNLEITLPKIIHRHGILGYNKLIDLIIREWVDDIKSHQKTNFITGYCGINPIVEIGRGLYNFFSLPVEQYQHDGCIARGIQRGAYSFGTSIATASIQTVNLLLCGIQGASGFVLTVVNPGPSAAQMRRRHRKKKKLLKQPSDIREGFANAIHVVVDGFSESAQNILDAAKEEHEQRGYTGAIGGVLRNALPAAVRPIKDISSATTHVIQGVQNQLRPDMHHEASQKWRDKHQ